MSQEYERRGEGHSSGRRYTPSHLAGSSGRGSAQGRSGAQGRPASGQSRRPTPPQGEPARRKKRKKRAGPAGVVLYLVFVLGLSALLAGVGWVMANDVLALNKGEHTAVITLSEDMFTTSEEQVEVTAADGTVTTQTQTVHTADMDAVADTLKENGIIEFKTVFKIFVWFTHAQADISPGTYELNTEMDYRAIVSSISRNSPNRSVATVTITEGMTVDQIFAALEERGIATQADLQETAANYPFKFSFLQDIPLGDYHRLEGYLFPDTYNFYMGGDTVTILNRMLLRFDEMVTDEMRAQAEDMGYSLYEIITIASMIEKETDGSDQADIASVIYNRLDNPNAGTNGLLQIDATILYVTGGTQVDTSVDTPYNTYLYPGLPPGPISNPGIDAINAALDPNDTSYFYYALGDDNVHHFFASHRELENFIASQERYNGSNG